MDVREIKKRYVRTVNRAIAWLMTTVMLCGIINPAVLVFAESDNWNVEYEFRMDDDIPVASEDGAVRIDVHAGESVAFDMTLMEGRNFGSSRFREQFSLYIPEELYDVMAEDGQLFENGWLESAVTEGDFLMERLTAETGKATGSNASSSNASTSDAAVNNGSGEQLKDGVYKVTLGFVEELRKAGKPADIRIEETTGSLSFVVPEDMTLVIRQEGNDCRLGVEESLVTGGANPKGAPEKELSLQIREDGGLFTDLVSWHPDRYSERQVITLRVNYRFDKLSQAYEPGEIKIEIDSLAGYLSEATRLSDRGAIAYYGADCAVDSGGWDHDYSSGSTASKITFVNQERIENGVDGFFELQWNISGTMMPYEYDFQAKLTDDSHSLDLKSNECTLSIEKDKFSVLHLSKVATTADQDEMKANIVNLPADYKNYYWVKYRLNSSSTANAVLFAEYKLIDPFPQDCVVLDSSFKPANLNADHEYEVEGTVRTTSGGSVTWSGGNVVTLYVGYPKSAYNEGQTIKNTAELQGRYEDTGDWEVKEASCELALVDFQFNYTGNLYSVGKSGQAANLTVYEARNRVSDQINEGFATDGSNYWLSLTARYSGKPMDVVLGDDLLYITREGGVTTKLEDGEYRFNHIRIASFGDGMGFNYDGYRFTFEVRRAGNDFYEIYDTGEDTLKTHFFYFDRSDEVVAWRLTLHDIDGDIINTGSIVTGVDVYAKDAVAGTLHNFDYLQVYIDDVLQNPASYDDYATYSTKEQVARYDIETYGTYMQRDTYRRIIKEDSTPTFSISKTSSSSKDQLNNKTDIAWSLEAKTSVVTDTPDNSYVNSINVYDILPSGVVLSEGKETRFVYFLYDVSNVGTRIDKITFKNGLVLNTRTDIQDYMSDRMIMDVEHNYQDSGRTKVSFRLDFSDNPIDLKNTLLDIWNANQARSITWMRIILNTEISDADVNLYGNVVKNYAYGNADSTLPNGFAVSGAVKDNGYYEPIASDINGNGDLDERLAYSSNSVTINNPVSSIQTIKKFVRTSRTNNQFIAPYGQAGLDEDYTYRLSLTTGRNQLGSIVLYDTIETILDGGGNDITDGWRGGLQGFDTTFVQSRGFAPVIYYSASKNPNSLITHQSEWTEYDEALITDLEKAAIKTVAFDLRYDAGGNEKTLGINSQLYVNIHMKTPSTFKPDYAKNYFRTEWLKMDEHGVPESSVSGQTSNTVQVDLGIQSIPMIDLQLNKVDAAGQPVTNDNAVFGLYYDAAASGDPVKHPDGSNVELDTTLIDGSAEVSFAPDESKKHFDGIGNYYMLYLKEIKAPNGYYGLGGTKESPTNSYIIKIKVTVKADGTYTFSAVGENQDYSKLTVDADGIKIQAINYREPLLITLKAAKEYRDEDGSLQNTVPKFDFRITLVEGDGSAVSIPLYVVQNQTSGPRAEVLFEDIGITAAGTYKFDIVEIWGGDAGINYDDASHVKAVVTVIEDADGTLKLDGVIEYQKELNGVSAGTDPLFSNQALRKVKIQMKAIKTMTGMEPQENTFRFEAKMLNGYPVSTGTRTLRPGDSLAVAKNGSGGVILFEELFFRRAGAYVFEITERADASKDYIVYDDSFYYAYLVIGTDGITGQLTVAQFDYYDEDSFDTAAGSPKGGAVPVRFDPLFVNVYKPDFDIDFTLEKQLLDLSNNVVTGAIPAYQFELALNTTETDISLHDKVSIRPGKETAVNQTTGSKKSIYFDGITIKAAGQYIFDVTEKAAGAAPGTHTDEGTVRVTVTVVDQLGDGRLSHTFSYEKLDRDGRPIAGAPGSETVFINRITPAAAILKAEKVLNGSVLESGRFEFTAKLVYSDVSINDGDITYLTASGSNASLKTDDMNAVNSLSEVVFPELTFKKAGTYIIRIVERDLGTPGIVYDSSSYFARVAVKDDGSPSILYVEAVDYFSAHDGAGNVSGPCQSNKPIFTNRYVPKSVKAALELFKMLKDADGNPAAGKVPKFKFSIAAAAGNPAVAVIPDPISFNDDVGRIYFRDLVFDQAGTYQFVVSEVNTGDPDIQYSDELITVTVDVADDKAAGKLFIDNVSYSKADKTFVNVRRPETLLPDQVVLEAEKSLTGRVLKGDEFTFQSELIYASTGEQMADRTVKNNGGGKILFPVYTFAQEGIYIFRLSETAGSDQTVRYDGSVYYAQVNTVKAGSGILRAELFYGSGYDSAARTVTDRLTGGKVPEFRNEADSTITIRKVSKSSGTALAGAEFKLSCRNAGSDDAWLQHGGTLITGGKGGSIEINLPDAPWNKEYQLVETKAPAGYSRSRVGTITFTIAWDGTIAAWSHDGTAGYVELAADKTTLVVKNYTTDSGTDKPDPPTTPTKPTDPANPTVPPAPTVPANPNHPGNPLIPYTPGQPVPDGKQVITVIDDNGVPRSYLEDIPVTISSLARTGDNALTTVMLLAILTAAAAVFGVLLVLRNRGSRSGGGSDMK